MAGRKVGASNISYEQYLTVKKAIDKGIGTSDIVDLMGISDTTVERIRNGTHSWDDKIRKAEEEKQLKEAAEKAQSAVPQIDLSGVTRDLDNIQIRMATNAQTMDGALTKLFDLLSETNSKLGQIHTMLCRINTNAGDMSEDMKKLSKGLAD